MQVRLSKSSKMEVITDKSSRMTFSSWISVQIDKKNETRGHRMVNSVLKIRGSFKNNVKDHQVIQPEIKIDTVSHKWYPSYETTKGLTPNERQAAVEGWRNQVLFDEPEHITPAVKPLVPYSDSSDEEDESNNTSVFPAVEINLSEVVQQQTIDFNDSLTYTADSDSENNTVSHQGVKKRIRNKDFCFYCETLVSTFARHILRNHNTEIEVQRIKSKPSKSKERKHLIAALRKKGNYLYSTTNVVKPVRTPTLPSSSDSFLPCTYCLGFYSRKQLWKHRKSCPQNPGNQGKESSLIAGQNYLLKDIKFHSQLYEQVFPRMRADMVSLTAKKDPLICSYGSRYLLTHRDKHQVNVTSRKMRELAKLLIEIKKIEPRIRNLLQALKPEYFDILVEATKVVSSYDHDADRYNAPTYAMNISTSLKECCEIGITYALKKKHLFGGQSAAEAEAELRTSILLLKSNWKYEISHQAANNLHFNKMNKITIVPLASDLKLFRDYLVQQGIKAALKLNTNQHDLSAYRQLTEITYCRVLLLCRKRVGELQRLPLALYENTSHNHSYEEFEHVVTPMEMMLIRKFKRVVIQGKRKVTPVLFSFDVQKHIDLLTEQRKYFVPAENKFLFANANTINPIVGYKVLQKHSKMAGLKTPESITSRSLRKHLATISQLFQLNDQDIEQLASFMGHTSSVHRSEYRLPDDVFQTAKIAKLLLSMESGEGAKHKGKSLDEIEINLEDDLLQTTNIGDDNKDSNSSDDEDGQLLPLSDLIGDHGSSCSSSQPTRINYATRKTKIRWTDEEKNVVFNYFKNHIENSKPPKKFECEKLMSLHPTVLKNKTWPKIKVLVQNLYTKKSMAKINT